MGQLLLIMCDDVKRLKKELKTHPNGTEYYELRMGRTRIGFADIVDGGFLAQGRGKPVATLKEAAKQMLDSKMNVCMVEHENLRKLLGRVLSET